jgi:hypothetical protein
LFRPIAAGFDGANDSFPSQIAGADKFQPMAVYKFLEKGYIRLVIKTSRQSFFIARKAHSELVVFRK